MAVHISKVVTRTGDQGLTGLADGSRVKKSSLRIQAVGEVDELNSLLGLAVSLQPPETVSSILTQIQHQLFAVGAELSSPGGRQVAGKAVAMLEGQIAAFNEGLPPLNGFLLPGGTAAAAQIHVARSVCRRAERTLVALDEAEKIPAGLLCYLNRLSDLLFILARVANRAAGCPESLSK